LQAMRKLRIVKKWSSSRSHLLLIGLGMKKRNIFAELMTGIEEMDKHREGKITLKTHRLEKSGLPRMNGKIIREVREGLNMSQAVFADLLRINLATLRNWEQGRAKPNDQAITLILLIKKFPDTLQRLAEVTNKASGL